MLNVKRKFGNSTAQSTSVSRAQLSRQTLADSTTVRKASVLSQAPARVQEPKQFQSKVPVITGEAHYRGLISVDGFLSGQLGANSGCFSVRQKPNAAFGTQPEMDGELNFRDMVRVNGYIAGSVSSPRGTLIVDIGARVDANIDVAVALISGTVNGDIVARDRVEIGPVAKIHGNIWTRSITIKDGAVFDGVCSMIDGPEA